MTRYFPTLMLWSATTLALGSACVTADDEQDGSASTSTAPGSAGPTGAAAAGNMTTDTEATSGNDTAGNLPAECAGAANLVVDPGFEAGTEGDAWSPTSLVFITPICDEDCTKDVGARPFSGNHWVWFGGIEEPDTASVRQTVSIAEDAALLRFWFSVNAAADIGQDTFVVSLDGEVLFSASNADGVEYLDYQQVEISIPTLTTTEGGTHELVFEASLAGAGLTNFFLDAVSLYGCGDAMTTGSSGSTTMAPGTSSTGGGTSSGASTSSSSGG